MVFAFETLSLVNRHTIDIGIVWSSTSSQI